MTEHQAGQYQIPTTPDREVIGTYNLTGEQSADDVVRAALLDEALGHANSARPFEKTTVDQGRREGSQIGAASTTLLEYEPAPIPHTTPSPERHFDPESPIDLLDLSKTIQRMRRDAQEYGIADAA